MTNLSQNFGLSIRFFRYALLSLVGLCLSTVVFFLLQNFTTMSVFNSNLVGDFAALTLVFIVSWRSIFDHRGLGIATKYVFSTVVKVATILCLSGLLTLADFLFAESDLNLQPGQREFILTVLKVLAAPLTLVLNYIITKYFIHGR